MKEPINISIEEPIGITKKQGDSESECKNGERDQVRNLEEEPISIEPTTCTPTTISENGLAKPPLKNSWREYLNPLKWGPIPPVPNKRSVSREYSAGPLSCLYFHWLTPLMNVSNRSHLPHDP